jgi:hypothetical protein
MVLGASNFILGRSFPLLGVFRKRWRRALGMGRSFGVCNDFALLAVMDFRIPRKYPPHAAV